MDSPGVRAGQARDGRWMNPRAVLAAERLQSRAWPARTPEKREYFTLTFMMRIATPRKMKKTLIVAARAEIHRRFYPSPLPYPFPVFHTKKPRLIACLYWTPLMNAAFSGVLNAHPKGEFATRQLAALPQRLPLLRIGAVSGHAASKCLARYRVRRAQLSVFRIISVDAGCTEPLYCIIAIM